MNLDIVDKTKKTRKTFGFGRPLERVLTPSGPYHSCFRLRLNQIGLELFNLSFRAGYFALNTTVDMY